MGSFTRLRSIVLHTCYRMKQAIFLGMCLLVTFSVYGQTLWETHLYPDGTTCTKKDYPTEFEICNTVELTCESMVASCDGHGDVCFDAVSPTMDNYINSFDFSAVRDCVCRKFECTKEGVVVENEIEEKNDDDEEDSTVYINISKIGIIE